jgi:hypothetical protein
MLLSFVLFQSVILIIARDIIVVRMVLIKVLNVHEVLHGMKKRNHVHGLNRSIAIKRKPIILPVPLPKA